ncbi:MAG TPA: bifunctional riboflavin kinase/FAD synthetase [Ignavibacteria bacterium]|nr:bifunctional riboflavin kinase/FAD synthetase [Ignavibacteria bacterium]
MKVFESLSKVTINKNSVVTLGTFDGVHLGHRKIIEMMKNKAEQLNSRDFLITFYPHPRKVVPNNSYNVKLLTTQREKIGLLKSLDIQNILIINFTKEFSQLSYNEFLENYIINGTGLKNIVIGYDHHFGKGRNGNADKLRELSSMYGFNVTTVDAVSINGIAVSSTKIRNALLNGNINEANSYLGRFYSFGGTVIKGDGRGRLLGFPTANLKLEDDDKLLPAIGIYAVECFIEGKKFLGVMSIGKRPTFYDSGKITTEIYIIDFEKDIYGDFITVNVIDKIRGEEKFSSTGELIKQMKKDTEIGIKILTKQKKLTY